MREIAAAIGNGLRVPIISIPVEEALDHFGRVSGYAGLDLSASSAITRQQLGWFATGPGLMEDLGNVCYEVGSDK